MTRPDSQDPLMWHEPMPWMQPPPCDYALPGYQDAVRAHRRMVWRDRAQRWFRAGMIGAAGALIGAMATLALTREAGAAAPNALPEPAEWRLTLILHRTAGVTASMQGDYAYPTWAACRTSGEAAVRWYDQRPDDARLAGFTMMYRCEAQQ